MNNFENDKLCEHQIRDSNLKGHSSSKTHFHYLHWDTMSIWFDTIHLLRTPQTVVLFWIYGSRRDYTFRRFRGMNCVHLQGDEVGLSGHWSDTEEEICLLYRRVGGFWPITAAEGKKSQQLFSSPMGFKFSKNGSFPGFTSGRCRNNVDGGLSLVSATV
jgi:hypothetical protein